LTLSVPVDYPPMEALLVDEIPAGREWRYEPKWDGFRCLAFPDGDSIALQLKSGQPLARYFPEVVEALRALEPERFVVDSRAAARRWTASEPPLLAYRQVYGRGGVNIPY